EAAGEGGGSAVALALPDRSPLPLPPLRPAGPRDDGAGLRARDPPGGSARSRARAEGRPRARRADGGRGRLAARRSGDPGAGSGPRSTREPGDPLRAPDRGGGQYASPPRRAPAASAGPPPALLLSGGRGAPDAPLRPAGAAAAALRPLAPRPPALGRGRARADPRPPGPEGSGTGRRRGRPQGLLGRPGRGGGRAPPRPRAAPARAAGGAFELSGRSAIRTPIRAERAYDPPKVTPGDRGPPKQREHTTIERSSPGASLRRAEERRSPAGLAAPARGNTRCGRSGRIAWPRSSVP